MKLLAKPTTTKETITIGGDRTKFVTRINLLGYLGIGPLAVTTEERRQTPKCSFAGRTLVGPVTIDFESQMVALPQPGEVYQKVDHDLDFEGVVYRLLGIIPLECLYDNVWRCSIDTFEVNP